MSTLIDVVRSIQATQRWADDTSQLHEQMTLTARMLGVLGRQSSPAAIVQQPEPERQQIAPADYLGMIERALREKAVTSKQVLGVVASAGELPSIEGLRAEAQELEALEQAWNKKKGRQKPERFARDHNMSKATLYRRWDRLRELRVLIPELETR